MTTCCCSLPQAMGKNKAEKPLRAELGEVLEARPTLRLALPCFFLPSSVLWGVL